MKYLAFTVVSFCLLSSHTVLGESPKDILQIYETKAREEIPDFKGFSAKRGESLYLQKEQSSKGVVSCSLCHTPDPRALGRTRANKDIEPLAPATNPKRFTDPAHVEKWFGRNCDDVLKRPCTVLEKGDFIAFMLSIK